MKISYYYPNLIPMIVLPITMGLFVHNSNIESVVEVAHDKTSVNIAQKSSQAKLVEVLRLDAHVHNENTTLLHGSYNLSSQTPASQPKKDDDGKKLANKRVIGANFDSDFVQPLI